MARLKFACLQMPVAFANVAENLRVVEGFLSALEPQDVDVICLPEMWTTEFTFQQTRELAQASRQALQSLAGQAKRLGAFIIGSCLEMDDSKADSFFNTAHVLNPKGRKECEYRKIHLFTPGYEDYFFDPGETLRVFSSDQVKFGLTVCYDLRFPELFRALCQKEVSVILVPAAWPAARAEHWRLLLQARAIENQVFMVGVNRTGRGVDGFEFAGQSLVVDPWGEILWQGASKTAACEIVEIDLKQVGEVREKIPVWKDARWDLYKDWLISR